MIIAKNKTKILRVEAETEQKKLVDQFYEGQNKTKALVSPSKPTITRKAT